MVKKMIVTADDYGMSRAVNDAINAGVEAGLITTTNVMTNMPLYQEAKELRKYPGISVGLHWTLACGKPVAPAEQVPTLVIENGEFYPYPVFRQRYRKGLISDADIKTELRAQYDRFVELMGQPDYWNTHQNTHVDFKIFGLVLDLAKELNITKMRSHERIYVPGSDNTQKLPLTWRLLEPIKSRMLNSWMNKARKSGVHAPDGLLVCLNKQDINRLDHVFHNIQWDKHEVAEYVIHPATCNDSPYFGKIVDQRIREYEMFTSEDTKVYIADAGIELVSFENV